MKRSLALLCLMACGGASQPGTRESTPTPAPTPVAPLTPVRPAPHPLPPLPTSADDQPTGSLRLEGQVLGAQDVPAAGAKLTISDRTDTATSQADGSFAFDHLPAGSYTVTARVGDGRNGSVTVTLTAASEPVLIRLRAVEEY